MKSRVIGLTGGAAAGKSEAAKILEGWGARIIDADRIARETAEIPEIRAKLEKEWPQAFKNHILERKKLRGIIFSSKSEREKLNQILHPLILERILQETRACGSQVCVVVAPLLIETGLHQVVDQVWVIEAPTETQIRRLMQRDGISREQARQILDSQLPAREKSAHAHRVFKNDESPESLKNQLRKEWDSL